MQKSIGFLKIADQLSPESKKRIAAVMIPSVIADVVGMSAGALIAKKVKMNPMIGAVTGGLIPYGTEYLALRKQEMKRGLRKARIS